MFHLAGVWHRIVVPTFATVPPENYSKSESAFRHIIPEMLHDIR